jgi:G:T/U-mismatch repair DNA glycosylase
MNANVTESTLKIKDRHMMESPPTRWGKWHMDDDDRELIEKYQIYTTEATHKHISSSYWRTINQLVPRRLATKLILPASYQLEYVNWIQKTFDYLVSR